MGTFLNVLPPELQSAPALVAGFLALLGLILLTAGVKIARPLAAALTGGMLATVAAWVLPTMVSIDQVTAGVIGLALGLLIGVTAFRAVQGVVLAVCLAVLAAGAFYQWQAGGHPVVAKGGGAAVAMLNPATPAGRAVAAMPAYAQTMIQRMTLRWSAIPGTMRQSMLVIGAGVAILAIFIAWLLPRPTTWLMSAVGGVALLVYGGMVLIGAYLPQYVRLVPTDGVTRWAIVGSMVAIGLAVQRLFFWPGKGQQREREKDRPGDLAAA